MIRGHELRLCVHHVDRALRELSGVSRVEARLRDGKVQVEHDPASVDAAALIEGVKAAGFEAKLVT